MAQALPRTGFNSSALVRSLAGLAVPDVSGSKQSFAERLGQWLDFNGALALYSALNAGTDGGAEAVRARSSESAAARQAIASVRSALVESMNPDGVRPPGRARIEWPAPATDATADGTPEFAPYHRYYLAHQRDMSANVGPLRANVRAALSRRSPALKRLAVLDAVLEQGLAGRERDLLATVPALLTRRFETLYQAHRATAGDGNGADDPGRRAESGGWLAAFRGDMQAVLRAELELRLQPVVGLIAALDGATDAT